MNPGDFSLDWCSSIRYYPFSKHVYTGLIVSTISTPNPTREPVRSQESLAQLAGVTRLTVHRALKGQAGVGEQTRRRIQRLAKEVGYRPNAAARTTRTGRFGTVALLMGTKEGRSSLPDFMLTGIHNGLAVKDLNLMVVRQSDERLTDKQYVPRMLREACSDGLLIDYTHGFPTRLIDLIEAVNLPSIWLNSKLPQDCVYPNDFDAGLRATRHLISLGHRRIAFADYTHGPAFPDPHYSAADRRLGYANAMTEAGLTPRLHIAPVGEGVPSRDRVAFSRQLLSCADRPTAVVAYGETAAIPVFHAAVALGLSVPSELSLVTFSDRPVLFMGPAFATMLVPQQQVGTQAVEMLLRKIAQPRERLERIAVPFDFDPGQTSATPING